MFSRFFYADSGIINNRGHHTNICRAFVAKLRASPFPTHVLAHAEIDNDLRQEFNAAAFFRYNPYWITDGDPVCGWLNAFHDGGQSFFRDLSRIGDVSAGDLFYFPSVQAAQLMGIVQWLGGMPPERRPATVIEFLLPSGVVSANGPDGTSYSLPDLRENPYPVLLRFSARRIPQIGPHRLRFGFVDGEGARAYAALLNRTVHKLPSPQCAFAPPHSRKGRDPITVSVLGHQRNNKGYKLVPEIARRLFKSRPDVRMLVHNSDPESTPKIQDELRAMAQADSRLTLEEGAIDIGEWAGLFERTDIMLCPYDPVFYRNGISGIVAEAVANAIPLVLPAGTTIATEFGDTSIAFRKADVDGISTAVEQLVDCFDAYAEAALASALRWQAVNGPKNMVHAVLALAQSAD